MISQVGDREMLDTVTIIYNLDISLKKILIFRGRDIDLDRGWIWNKQASQTAALGRTKII